MSKPEYINPMNPPPGWKPGDPGILKIDDRKIVPPYGNKSGNKSTTKTPQDTQREAAK